MTTVRVGVRFAGCLLACGLAAAAAAATPPPAAQMLNFRPKQEGIPYSTPAEAEVSLCKVELVTGPGAASGWLLRDTRGLPLRRFVASKGSKGYVDIWSYYQDGVETYREMDSTSGGGYKPDQYRWLGPAGSKWGVDLNHDGRISAWKMISAEEVSQEILQAVTRRDPARLHALMLSEVELKSLELPAAEADRIRGQINQATNKLMAVSAKLALTEKARWMHLETGAPQCVPAEATGGKYDIVRHKGGTILYEHNGKHGWLQTGELVQIGRSWRVVDGPAEGHYADTEAAQAATSGQTLQLDDAIKPLIERLKEIDAGAPKEGSSATAIVRYNQERATVLEQIVAKAPPAQRDQWLRQVADCLSAAAQYSPAGDKAAYERLVALRDRVAKEAPGSILAGYVTFREMSAEYANRLTNPKGTEDLAKLQETWRDRLKQFVEQYPIAEDAPDAVMQLGMVSEFVNKETEAKNWYEHLTKKYGNSPLAAKAQGAIKRLNSEGKPFELAGPVLGSGAPFSVTQMHGKAVVVYYWASWNAQCAADFLKLKSLQQNYGSKDLELVCVSLDNSQADAIGFLKQNPLTGTHLFQAPGGLDSPLAVQYGVMVLPNMFLVGKDGKVVSRTVQMGGLEDEVKKLVDVK
jgi:thiol-disulfide isomerase/thioredoxin